MSVCWLSSASRKTFRTILSLHGDAVLTSVSMETITWKTLYLLPWATGGHLHGDTRGFNIECVSLMCHMDSLVEETLCVLFWKKYGTLLFNMLKNFIWFNINVMTQNSSTVSVTDQHAAVVCFNWSSAFSFYRFWLDILGLFLKAVAASPCWLSGYRDDPLGVKPAQTERADLSRTFVLHQFGLITFFYRFFKSSTETPENNKTWVMIQSLR